MSTRDGRWNDRFHLDCSWGRSLLHHGAIRPFPFNPAVSVPGRWPRRDDGQNSSGGRVDDDLDAMSREQLIAEAKKLREGIRAHRDSTGQELCWHHPALWGLLPEKTDPQPTVPTWPEFLRGCVRYRQSLDQQLPEAPRTDESYRGER
jgi:hypothetical protein